MSNTTDDLARLADLHRQGALTDDEFAQAKARVLAPSAGAGTAGAAVVASLNRLQRSRDERWLGGVCGGLARLSGVAAWVWRMAFVLLVLFGGTGLVLYVLLWVLLPSDPPLTVRPRQLHS